jgi:hypothetical protein
MGMRRRLYQLVLIGGLSALFAGCGGGGGGGGDEALVAPIGDLSGVWTVSDTPSSTQCAVYPDEYPLTLTQTGNSLSVFDGSNTFNGTISGNTVRWTGSYPDAGGTTTITSLTATVAPTCNSFSGNSTWTWSAPGETCSGTSTFTGTRNDPIGCGGGGGGSIAEVEPNNTPALAQSVTRPVTISGSIVGDDVSPTDIDIFKFTMASAGTVTITLTGGTVQDMDLYLLDSTETIIASGTTLVSNESISMSVGSGTYYVAVYPYDVSAVTSYTLSIQ